MRYISLLCFSVSIVFSSTSLASSSDSPLGWYSKNQTLYYGKEKSDIRYGAFACDKKSQKIYFSINQEMEGLKSNKEKRIEIVVNEKSFSLKVKGKFDAGWENAVPEISFTKTEFNNKESFVNYIANHQGVITHFLGGENPHIPLNRDFHERYSKLTKQCFGN
ncbi:hypothetical protein [Enterobacter sp. 18A13]|uniref:hypothetical protein n=1 Tax=Enterobacter sp. 18A13 TaxID=2565914 RepID=UPI0010CA270F|nr:hypothetical protein [Enterobacter sp. 18A13]BBJ69901.1 hypothetical protein ECC18A13_p11430 [Enterobacter sp. 18A13]